MHDMHANILQALSMHVVPQGFSHDTQQINLGIHWVRKNQDCIYAQWECIELGTNKKAIKLNKDILLYRPISLGILEDI